MTGQWWRQPGGNPPNEAYPPSPLSYRMVESRPLYVYLLSVSASGVINAIKALANISDHILLLSQVILDPIIAMKREVLHAQDPALSLMDVLTALSLCEATNPTVSMAVSCIKQLQGCEAHCTVMLSKADEDTLHKLGVNITCDPEFSGDPI